MVHSTLKILIEIDHTSTCSILKCSALATTLKEVCLLIWDKCSMQNHFAFEAVDWSLQDICHDIYIFTLPFSPFS
jgi:hypothetical protein